MTAAEAREKYVWLVDEASDLIERWQAMNPPHARRPRETLCLLRDALRALLAEEKP